MKINKKSLTPIDFEGLKIFDYTTGRKTSSSVAEIIVPPGGRHRKAFSKKSDKYYYLVSGQIQFSIDDEAYDLAEGDFCIIAKGQRFCYNNDSNEEAKLILFHTPSFDIEAEAFED